ncbi:branched-chain amino acid ABC transporter permease [Halobaculum sp. CBA1158]|uniref:branched-chain amino acid ABC transporter permease n=1 Tax=Halobaculum sp. CBA1158 TaxID=2904243 RepID=UPI001F1CCEC3|nr:branched-chain amino acid ABC transporter permease [Halobaculum sp. CBA1158]UIO98822.1 branched-chain amino acid ABC transporter permease [Halobaculum sp. CBA1158]
MGISETYTRGRALAVDRPFALAALTVVALLFLDVIRQVATPGGLTGIRLATYLWDGLVVGLSIGVAGVGLSMTYSILNFANFGHGDYVTSGAFAGWAATWVVAGVGQFDLSTLLFIGSVSTRELGVSMLETPLAIIVGLAVAAVATIVLSLVIDRLVYRPMRDEGGITLLIASIGVALALRYSIYIVFGQRTRGLTDAQSVPEFAIAIGAGSLEIGGHEMTLVVVAAALMLGVHFLLQTTKLGKAMRAMADNEDLARVTGIPTERVVRFTWIIGGGLAGAGGFLIALERGAMNFQFGWILLLLIFAAVILGGIGSIYGAMFGGITMGLAQSLSLVWLPSEFSTVAAFAVMIVVLLVKPDGLFSGVTTA